MSTSADAEPPLPIEVHHAEKGDKLANILTMIGHLSSDINQGALAAVLPFLVVAYGYSYTDVAMLIFVSNIASAIIQPLFGWIGDRRSCPWFMALGVFLAGVGMCGIGFLETYEGILASALLLGIGVAMFHPEGGRLANLAAGQKKAGGMSIFAVGGNIGFFVGPVLTTVFLSSFGLHGTLVFLIPAFACAALLISFNGRFKALGIEDHGSVSEAGETEHWGRFSLTLGILSVRSIIVYGLMAFIPLFLLHNLGQSEAISSLAVSAFSIAGAVATFFSGKMSERVGTLNLMIACLIATAAFIIAVSFNQSVLIAFALAMALAVTSDLFYPSMVALAMGYIPHHLGTASGLCYGVAVCIGGGAEPFLGAAGDAFGLIPVMWILAAITAACALLGVLLRRIDEKKLRRFAGKPLTHSK